MRIDACFDSHVHWAATGEFSQRLRLDDLTRAEDITMLKPEPHHHRGEWLLGYGWRDADWPSAPHRNILDRWRPSEPIVLTKSDGHTRWLSSEAMRRAGLLDPNAKLPSGAVVERDDLGQPTGVISERANDLVDRAMPPATAFTVRRDLLAAVRTFNEAGFTHVRDMTCDEAQWNEAVRLDESGLLTMAVEEFFWVRDPADVSAMLDLATRARGGQTSNLNVRGLKIFFDGSLGSEGALLSRCYHERDHAGVALWSREDLRDVLTRAWARGFDVAVHAIGDEASARVIDVAVDLNAADIRGRLHLEHAQILRADTIERMKTLDIRCHLQPSHWLADHPWLGSKIGELNALTFPWRRLQEAGIAFDFGSDAPIEPPSVVRTRDALKRSAAAGVPRLLGQPERYMTHPDPTWTPNSFTIFEDDRPSQVVFRGQHLI